MKKIIATLSLSLAFATHTFAAGDEYVLFSQSYDGENLSYHYKINDKTTFTQVFEVPKELRENIDTSGNSILEAKKELTVYYTYMDFKDKLAELNNQDLYHIKGEKLSVDFDLKNEFTSEKNIAYNYIQSIGDKDEYIKKFKNKQGDVYKSYKEIDAGSHVNLNEKNKNGSYTGDPNANYYSNNKTLAQNYKDDGAVSVDKNKSNDSANQSNGKSSNISIILSIFGLIVLIGIILFFVSRKRR
jgi:hypothetical protein